MKSTNNVTSGCLAALESGRLAALEAIIERGMKTFIEVGSALLEIRDSRLYRDGFATFEDYCQERWKWHRRYGDRLIEAASVATNLSPIGLTPQNEAQARELARLTPEQQREVAVTIDFTTSTAADVRAKVEEIRAADMAPTKSLAQLINERRRLLLPAPAPPPRLSAEERREEESQRRQREASSARQVELMKLIQAIETIADTTKSMVELAAFIQKLNTPDVDWPGECQEAYARLRAICRELDYLDDETRLIREIADVMWMDDPKKRAKFRAEVVAVLFAGIGHGDRTPAKSILELRLEIRAQRESRKALYGHGDGAAMDLVWFLDWIEIELDKVTLAD